MEDAFTAFLDALDARPTVFTSPVRTEGREATCVALFRAYATLLTEYAEKPG